MSAEPRHVTPLVRDLLAGLELPGGWTLLDWDVDHGISLTLEQGGAYLLVELCARDDAADCLAKTARFNLTARDPFGERRQLGAPDRAVIDAVLAHLHRREGSLPVVPRQSSSRAQIREIHVERALVQEGRGQYYLNPYVGCTIGCSFCFVEEQADLSRALEGLPRQPWGRWVDVKTNLPEVLREDVARLSPGIVRMSPIVTDPYQPLERRHRVTRRCLEVLLEAGFSPCILTRAARITEDIPLLARFDRALVGVSVPTDDDRVRHTFEPGADPIDARLEALAACRAAGLRTFAVVQPMLPQDPEKLVTRLAPLIDVVRIDRLHLENRVRDLYTEHGYAEALESAWIDRTQRSLERGFSAYGVRLHPLDDLRELML